jgi:hypothetical protein
MTLAELEKVVGKRHEENKERLKEIEDRIEKIMLDLAEKKGSNHTVLSLVSLVVIPVFVVLLQHFLK